MFVSIGTFETQNLLPTLDVDAAAFISATSITDYTPTIAVNNLVISLKDAGIWSRFDAIYPFVGCTAFTHKFNLKNPADTDAAFRLGIVGDWVHSCNGVRTGNDFNNGRYINTFFVPNVSSTLNDFHMSIYSRTSGSMQGIDMATRQGTDANRVYNGITVQLNSPSDTSVFQAGLVATQASASNSDGRGHYIVNRNPLLTTTTKGFKNGTEIASSIQTHVRSGGCIKIGARGTEFDGCNTVSGTGQEVVRPGRNYAFASIGEGFSDAEASDFYTIVQTFQTTLGRQV